MSASMIGALVGVVAILARRRDWSAKIPFGPYLALGALLWMFDGAAIVHWYLSLMTPQP
jgi:leader peptidase (prepilin peptidase)/N-methyltransferase